MNDQHAIVLRTGTAGLFVPSRTRSTLSALRNRSFNLDPLRKLRSSTCAKAPPLPGLT